MSRWGAVATLSLCLYLVPTAVGATVWEMTLKGSSWLYDFDGEKMVRDSQVDNVGGKVALCPIPIRMEEGYYYMMPDSQLYVLRRDLRPGYVKITNPKYENVCAQLSGPDEENPDE
jgi:hypothetical protein